LGEIYLIIPNNKNIKIEKVSDVINTAEYISNNTNMDTCYGKAVDMLLKTCCHNENKIFNDSLNDEHISVPLIFYNKNENGLSIPIIALNDFIIKVHFNKEFINVDYKNIKLSYETVILGKEDRLRFERLISEYLIKKMLVNEFDFNSPTTTIELKNIGEIKTIIFEIMSDEMMIDDNGYLIDASLYIDDKLTSYITPFISRKNMAKEFGKYSSVTKNIYVFKFSLNQLFDFQPSGTIICIKNMKIILNMKCSNGKLILYTSKYHVIRMMGGIISVIG